MLTAAGEPIGIVTVITWAATVTALVVFFSIRGMERLEL